ncbi:hypothetical protein [Anaerorhabdus furcosa]|uniref:Uncharacterized protein n=1 Tax=Anaerorhabdus furcosa TaxID=118967 RepID=A0A1T4PSP6_9FIRM|nr:hypothetical protein [Anaerorhabdus furcosa]SJZ94600.1 hypothetical protein SAMN02745191_2141 [Anaerorhabdus furcosa]
MNNNAKKDKEKDFQSLINIQKVNEKKYVKSFNGVFWVSFSLLLFFGTFSFLNSKTVSDIPYIFSMEEIGYDNNKVEKATKRTKYSGDVIYELSVSSNSIDGDEYSRVDITIYDFISNDTAVKLYNDLYEENNKKIEKLIGRSLSDFGVEHSYSLYPIEEIPGNGQENSLYLYKDNRVIIVRINSEITLNNEDLITIVKLFDEEL